MITAATSSIFTSTVLAQASVPASQSLVIVGTCGMGAIGGDETRRAVVTHDPHMIGFAAREARLVDIDPNSAVEMPIFLHRGGEQAGKPISLGDIESQWGEGLRQNMGIRFLDRSKMAAHVPSDIGAPLPHDLEDGGLRELSGLTYKDIRNSPLKDMWGLFSDERELGPSLQAQLFLYGGLGALAALPRPLSEMVPDAHRFRVAAACCFQGHDAFHYLGEGRQKGSDLKQDKVAYRLSSLLSTHGPAMINTMLSPAVNLSRAKRRPELLDALLRGDGSELRNVPQAPLVANAACASALLAFNEIAAQFLMASYPGFHAPELVLWVAADAALQPDARVIEGFGGAMMTRAKLAEINAAEIKAGQVPRLVGDSLAPFDKHADGTVVEHAGTGALIMTEENAVTQGADILFKVAGWGQSGETGGKGHMAGVGFGGENAIIHALRMAQMAHGYGVTDFGHLIAHATGTHTNSVTDLNVVHQARLAAAQLQGFTGRLPDMTVGAPKSIEGHSMGETGLKSISEAGYYLTGNPTIGIPTLRTVDPDLGEAAEYFKLSADPVPGNDDGGVILAVQGFGGYMGAMVLKSANEDTLRRSKFSDPKLLAAYLEKWQETRQERIAREARQRRTPGFTLNMAVGHRWPGMDD